jgi:hypothetical protein
MDARSLHIQADRSLNTAFQAAASSFIRCCDENHC